MAGPSDPQPSEKPREPSSAGRRRIRNYLLDARFQLRYATLLASVALCLFAVLGVVIVRAGRVSAEVSNAAVDLAGVAADQAERTLQESQASARLVQLQRLSESAGDPAVARAMQAELDAVDAQGRAALRTVQRQREQARAKRAEIERQQRRALWTVILGGLALGLALFAVGIVLSHRIVGPSYRLRQLFWKVSRGDLEITERLREGDELVDLFEAFTSMVAALRAQQAADLASLDAALHGLAKRHPDDEGVKTLRATVAQMRGRRGAQESVTFTPGEPEP